MLILEPKTFNDVMKPLLYFNCCVGMGVFRSPNQSCATYIIMKLYTLLYTLFYWTTIYITSDWMGQLTVVKYSSPLAFAMWKVLFWGNICIALITPLLMWLQRKGLTDCMRQMSILDNTFEAVLGAPNEYKKLYIRLLCQVVTILLVVILLSIADISTRVIHTTIRSGFMLWSVVHTSYQPLLLMLLLDTNFCTFIGYLVKKFRDLNNSLLTMRLTEKPSSSNPGKRLFVIPRKCMKTTTGNEIKNTEVDNLIIDKHYLLREIRKVHLELCKLSGKINLVFGIQNLLSTGTSFVMITGLLYTVYSTNLRETNTYEVLSLVTAMILWAFIYICKIWMVNHSCWSITNEAGKTGEVIYELLNSTADKELQIEIQRFSLQMLQNPVRFDACGFYTLDYTFVQGVIGSITTYLIILIQLTPAPGGSTCNTAIACNCSEISPN